jgi:hypothetical protein
MSSDSIAKREGCSVRKVNMTISLAFLAPDIVKVAIDGRLPHGMGVACLTRENEKRRAGLDQSGVQTAQWRIKKPQPQTDPFHYANHGQNLDKNIFMIGHEIT